MEADFRGLYYGFVRPAYLAVAGLSFLIVSGIAPNPALPAQIEPGRTEYYKRLPVFFAPNQGQMGREVRFHAQAEGYAVFLAPTEIILLLEQGDTAEEPKDKPSSRRPRKSTVLRMGLLGSNRDPEIVGIEEFPGKANYLIGDDRSRWRINVPTYKKVVYRDVYPGIDLLLYGNESRVSYNFIVGLGADPDQIRVKWEGAGKVEQDAQGGLVLDVPGGRLRQERPLIFQERGDGSRNVIPGDHARKGADEFGFRIDSHDRNRHLVIDPTLTYSTRLEGASGFFAGITVDAQGNAYVTGNAAVGLPTTAGAFQPTFGGSDFGATGEDHRAGDAFVAKLNVDGSALVYATYLGGSDKDWANGIAIDDAGNAYVTGGTISSNFPTTPDALRPTRSPGSNIFVTKLNPTGSALVYSTFLGAGLDSQGRGIAVDGAGNAHVTGLTSSSDLSTANAFQPTYRGGFDAVGVIQGDAFVAKLNPSGTALVYSTFFGGGRFEQGNGVATDSSGNTYVTGGTYSDDFPLKDAIQSVRGGAILRRSTNPFIAKFNSDGSLLYSTYFERGGNGIAADAGGNAYVTGGGIAKLNSAGSSIFFSNHPELRGNAIALDSAGNIYVTGSAGPGFPTENAVQPTPDGRGDAFVAKLEPTGTSFIYSTFLGGSSDFEEGWGIAADGAGSAYVVGSTLGRDFPTEGGLGGNSGAFIAKISDPVTQPAPTVENVIWTNIVNATATGNSLQKTSGCDGCDDAGGVSLQKITSGDGYVEFTVSETGLLRYVGLSNDSAGTGAAEIDFAIAIGWGWAEVRENGVYKINTPVVSGDLFRVAVESGLVKYYKNGALLFTSSVAPIYPLALDASLFHVGATVTGAVIAGALTGGSGNGADTTAPVIIDVTAAFITVSEALIKWNTNEESDSQVEYGTTTSYGTSSSLNTAAVTSHSRSLFGLSTNTVYHYRVKSRDLAGNLAVSGDFTFSTPTTSDASPPVISSVAASDISERRATISWATDEDADSQVDYGTTSAYGNSSPLDITKFRCHRVVLDGLSGNTLYHYGVKSRDAAGNLAVSGDFTFTTVPASNTSSPAISSVTASNITSSSATITWTTDVPSDSQADYGLSICYGSSSPLDTRLVTSHSVTLTGLSYDTSYHYRVRSRDAAGNLAVSADFFFTTKPPSDTTPPVISSVTATDITSSSASIRWMTNEPADSQVQYGTTTAYGSATALDTTKVTTHLQMLSGLTPSTLYHYRVLSRDPSGNLAISGDFTFATPAASSARSPFRGSPLAVPGTFQAEDFDNGGEGVAYHDMVAGNVGGQYRLNEDVDIVVAGGNGTGYRVNNIQTGEWLSYTIAVAQAGTYRIEANVSSQFPDAQNPASRFHIEIDGVNRTGSITVPNTGLWSTFQWVGVGGVELSAGEHILEIFSEQQYFDLDAIRILAENISAASSSVENVIWINVVNATATGNSLKKTSGCDGCDDAGAVSQQQITGDGYVEFTVTETDLLRYVGLSNGSSGTGYSEIDYAFAVGFGWVEVRENGIYRANAGIAAGDVLRIAVESGVVNYYINGSLIYTSAAAPVLPLVVDTSLFSLNATVSNALIAY